MISFLKKLWHNKRGNTLAIAAACMPLFIGAAGLATDTIQWTLWKRQLQRAADSAAIAGVYNREAASGATTTTDATVKHDLDLNLHTFYALTTGNPACSGKCVLKYDANCPASDASNVMRNRVCVTIAIKQPLSFSSMFLRSAPTITATSTAASIPAGGNACIEALDKTAGNAVYFSGNAAVFMPDCDVFSNSSATNTAAAKGSADVTADTVGGVGGIANSNNFHVTAYRPYSPALSDPFSGLDPAPGDMNCGSGSNATLDETTNFANLPTGVNCFTSVSVKSGATLNVPDNFGPIYVNGTGGVKFQGNFNCKGCTIVLTNNSGTSIGNITTNAGANVNITAPTTGKFKGVAIYQDRRASDCSNCNKINGNSASAIIGAIYFPSQEIQYNGTGNTTATCTMFVAKRVTFTGNSGTSNKFKDLADCTPEGLPSNSTIRMVRLVS